jgi:hypothetical protein
MLFGETVAVYCENHTEHKYVLWAVRAAQETYYASAREPNRLMLFGETVAVYCVNGMEHTDTLCGQFVPYSKLITSPLHSPTS